MLEYGMEPGAETADALDTRGLVPSFEMKVVRVDGPSGPEFKEVPYIRIVIPGDRSTEVHRPVEPEDMRRFAKRWALFQATKTNPIVGKPLTEWAGISPAEVATCHHNGVRSVEDLANLPEGRARAMGHGFLTLSVRAQDHLKQTKDEGYTAAMRKELEEARIRERLMASQLEEMKAALAEVKRAQQQPKGK